MSAGFRAIERWGSQSDRHAFLLVLALIGMFAAVLLIAAIFAIVYLLPPGTLDLW